MICTSASAIRASGCTNESKEKVKWLGYEFLKDFNSGPDHSLSLKWSGFDKSDELRSVYILNRAEGWDDFRSALETFRSLSMNCVYADVYGNIGMVAAGGIPIRKGNGIIIRNGETDEYDWKGYVPADQLPYSFNPAGGTVSSANNRIIDDTYPYFVSQSFDLPYRINRIREMLNEKELFSTDDFKMMLADKHSVMARLLTPYILNLSDFRDELSTLERMALDSLSGWDYNMDPNHIAPSILEFFRIDFKRNLIADELGELYDNIWDLAAENLVYRMLINGTNRWVDDKNTPENETLGDIVMKSFKDCIRALESKHGRDLQNWRWGRIHTITLMHPLGSVRVLDLFFHLNSEKYEIGGSDFTVCPYFSFQPGFKANLGASERYIMNTANWDESFSVMPGGASGVPGSEYYLSQFRPYIAGDFYKEPFSDDAVRSSAVHKMILVSGK